MSYFKKDMIYKGYSRIFVHKQEDMEQVAQILKDIDSDEYECYAPNDLLAVYSETEPLVYNGKFDLDIDRFYKECFLKNVSAYVVTKDDEL